MVASRPSSTPAAPSSSDPVQTDVVHWLVSCTSRIQPTSRSSDIASRVPQPPGTHRMSGRGQVVERRLRERS